MLSLQFITTALAYFFKWLHHKTQGGTQESLEFIYKKLCIYSYKFKLQSPSKYSTFDAIHLSRLFPLLKSVVDLVDFDAFLCFCHFLFHLFFFGVMFPFEDFFHPGKQKKSLGEIWWIGRVGHRVMLFLVKKCWALRAVWAGALVEYPSWNGQTQWKSLQKNSLKLNTASHNNTSWYTDTDGFLEHSPSQGSLYYKAPSIQKIILGCFLFLVFPRIYQFHCW